jgi:hypothetical protein
MFKVEVIADNSGEWSGNGIVFGTADEAEKWAIGLFNRWMAVKKWRVVRKSDAEGGMDEVVKEST